MLQKIIKFYYTLPRIRLRFSNPIVVSDRDSREYDWYLCRKKHGLDERELWCLGPILNEKVIKSDNGCDSIHCNLTQFTAWFKNNPAEIEWLNKRVRAYRDWECPTFYLDKDNDYNHLPEDVQKGIMDKLVLLTSKEGHADDSDIKFIYEHVFQLGW